MNTVRTRAGGAQAEGDVEEVCRVAVGQGKAVPGQQLLVGLEAVVAQQRAALVPQPPTALALLLVVCMPL